MRRRQNNPILTGEAGVGKTAVVEGLALRGSQLFAKFKLDELKHDLSRLTEGSQETGEGVDFVQGGSSTPQDEGSDASVVGKGARIGPWAVSPQSSI
jgi:hypothetical protein